MGECLVGFSHSVGILFLFISPALLVVCCHNLCGEFFSHAVACTFACEQNKVLHAYAHLAVRTDLQWNLESGATNPAAFNFNVGSDIVKSLLPDLERSLLHILH